MAPPVQVRLMPATVRARRAGRVAGIGQATLQGRAAPALGCSCRSRLCSHLRADRLCCGHAHNCWTSHSIAGSAALITWTPEAVIGVVLHDDLLFLRLARPPLGCAAGLARQTVECHVQLQYVHIRLAKEAEEAPRDVLIDQLPHRCLAQAACLGDARNLIVRARD